MQKVFEFYIRSTPQALWRAITDSEIRSVYNFGNTIDSDFTEGSSYVQSNPRSNAPLGDGVNLVVDAPRRLVQTMVARWSPEVEAEGSTRITWEIEQVEDSCRLLVTHDQLRDDANEQLYGGWPMILSGLKTYLETGEKLTTPGSLMYT
ncbi:protein of unknown function [Agreia sp. COWG]|nr:protein of unknown function [Agreia sp. COWG]